MDIKWAVFLSWLVADYRGAEGDTDIKKINQIYGENEVGDEVAAEQKITEGFYGDLPSMFMKHFIDMSNYDDGIPMNLNARPRGVGRKPNSVIDIETDVFLEKSYKQYSSQHLRDALIAVKKGFSVYAASNKYGVPRKTLRNWMEKYDIKNFAIANVTCEYEESSSSSAASAGAPAPVAGGDHNYDTRDPIEPPAFIIKQVNFNSANPSSPALNQQLLEMSHQLLSGGTFTSAPVVKLVSVAPAPVVSVVPDGNTKRVRRSEVLLKQAADCVSRGQTFQNVSDQFNIPISTIRFFMARKGILPRRKRGRSSQLAPASPIEPPYHMQHYKLPDMVSLRSSNSSDSMDKNMT